MIQGMIKSVLIGGKEEPRFTFLINNYSHPILVAILFLTLILRVLALLSLKESIYFDFLLWDERVYHDWAAKLANGTPVLSTYGFAPLPAYLMALIYKIFSPDILYVRIMNIILGALTCYLIYLIARELLNRTAGLIACLVAALYKPFIFYSIVPLKTSLSVFLFALTIYLFLSVINKYSIIKTVLLGLVIGLMLNVRPNCIVIIPLMPLLFIWNNYKTGVSRKVVVGSLIFYLAGILIAIFPFTIKNYRASGELKLTTGQSGYALYMGNTLENPDPYFRPVPFASSSPFEQGTQMIIEASRRAGKNLTPREASRFWTNETLKIAMERPGAFLWKICQKTLVLFNRFEAGDHYHIGFVSDFARFFKLPLLSLWLILPFGMAGMLINMFGSRRSFVMGLIFCIYASTMVMFYTSTRFRLPLLVILIPFAVSGLQNLFFNIKNRQIRVIGIYVAIVFIFVIIEFLPVQATDDMSPYYNTHAIILKSMGRDDGAMEYWEKSSRMDRLCSVSANLYLAEEYLRKGDIERAIFYLNKIPDNSFGVSNKYGMIGDVMVFQGKIEKAITAYEKSLEINSGRREIIEKLIKIFWRIDREKAMQEYDRLEYIISFYRKDMPNTQ